jgi:hypothetical protein
MNNRELNNLEKIEEVRELTQDELTSVSGGNFLLDLVRVSAASMGLEVWRFVGLPEAGSGGCATNHNGV